MPSPLGLQALSLASAPSPSALPPPPSWGRGGGNLGQKDFGREGGERTWRGVAEGGGRTSPSGFAVPLFNGANYIKFYILAAS